MKTITAPRKPVTAGRPGEIQVRRTAQNLDSYLRTRTVTGSDGVVRWTIGGMPVIPCLLRKAGVTVTRAHMAEYYGRK